MPDKDGYPTEEELKTIEKWDLSKHKVQDLLEHVRECWWQAEWGFDLDRTSTYSKSPALRLELHTGGWSGNEEIIGALQANLLFWALYWEKSERGGHYTFKIPVKKKSRKNTK